MRDDEIRSRVGEWQARLGLSHWQIAIIIDPDALYIGERRVIARCDRSEFYDRATVRLDKCVLDDDVQSFNDTIERDHINSGVIDWDEYIEVTIVHELLHVALRNLMEAGDLVRDTLSESQNDLWIKAWRRAEEELCERTAVALVEAWPINNEEADHGS